MLTMGFPPATIGGTDCARTEHHPDHTSTLVCHVPHPAETQISNRGRNAPLSQPNLAYPSLPYLLGEVVLDRVGERQRLQGFEVGRHRGGEEERLPGRRQGLRDAPELPAPGRL